jgi:hypothetical protein
MEEENAASKNLCLVIKGSHAARKTQNTARLCRSKEIYEVQRRIYN